MVVEFLHQGLLKRDDQNDSIGNQVVIAAKGNRPVASRILQLGPGDFCRLAFETIPGTNSYEIFYGGQLPKKESPKQDLVPKWRNTDGLILETRRFGRCNMRDLDSLRRAFEKAEPIGADYVETVAHSYNPMSPRPEPFFSRYSGTMNVSSGGNYTFWTSSQDCSFAIIDDKQVVSAPGRHRALRRARPEFGKTVRLSAGPHKFEYYHAAAGSDALMALAWLKGRPVDKKSRPTGIDPSVFRATSVGRAEPGALSTRDRKTVPDFRYTLAGEVPLPDELQPLVGVSFKDASPPGLATKSKFHWDFGDGQTSDKQSPAHVYLRPGLYKVSFSVKRGTRALTTTNHIHVDRPLRTHRSKEKPHKLDDYLAIMSTYDAKRLNVVAARQLVLAFLWKSDILDETRTKADGENDAAAEDDKAAADKAAAKGKRPQSRRVKEAIERRTAAEAAKQVESRQAESKKYLSMAVAAGSDALQGGKGDAAASDADVFRLAELVGPLARNRLGDSKTALSIWQKAAARISQPELKAKCELAAADIAVGDLLQPKAGKSLLDRADAVLSKDGSGPAAVRLDRVWGDYWASMGDGKAARKAYEKAQSHVKSSKSHVEKTAWRGAHSRSVEQFLKTKDWARAMHELQLWQADFPADKIDGYLTLLLARYWAGRGKYPQATTLAEQLMAVNPDSPYADQLLLLAAACEKKQGKPERAVAILHSLIKDYPGSPHLSKAKEMLAELEK